MAIINIGISKRELFDKQTLLLALWTGILVTLIQFLLNFFGLNFILDFVPVGFRLLIIVFVSIIISRKVIVRFRGKEVI